ncbi:glycosyltransferase [Loktanella sp. D2R18]|uniref:glycosyltransferase n=1 Tax=Rhodobacterales TaxID=204455 RepID=UPI000DEB0FF1|nr:MULTISPECIES: glycosyltransferase [Rhodobacterales]MDO6589462.1 glycosyltransferase [Yoonia sp. 1_MG-2023]RBW44113.1 glycosyltransferase [Loktanella sp. D2R18]
MNKKNTKGNNLIVSKNEANSQIKLSIIVPFRDEGVAEWYLPRLEALCSQFPKLDDMEFIVVDSGSVDDAQEKCRNICQKTGVAYHYHDTAGQTFSIGAARDFGACKASGRAVTFFDIDWRVPDDFWPRLLSFMKTYGISDYKKRFFVIPALYLTETGTQEFQETNDDNRFQEFYLRWLMGDTDSIQNMAPCSSVMVVDRYHYLSIGGHNPAFKGHGFEDFELLHRLLEEEGRLPKPDVFQKDAKTWDTATYNGFRSRLALLGRPAMLSNLFVVHLWHPRPKTLSFYNTQKMKDARGMGPELLKEFDRTGNHPTALLPSETPAGNVLILAQVGTNVARCVREIIPSLGNPIYMSESDFLDTEKDLNPKKVKAFMDHHSIKRIVFPNPYGNTLRKSLYDWCRATGFPYLSFERGALPDSWFLDPNGCNADSSSYDPEHWDHPLSESEKKNADTYINEVLSSDAALEQQGMRIGAEALAEQLKLGGKKVLFVPLQRPSDTVTTYMAGAAGSCTKFLSKIDEVSAILKSMGWVVLCKKHPLEVVTPELHHAQYVPQDTHFMDLLELCDATALINSGVGLYAMMMEKPCYVFGDAFYQIDGVNKAVGDIPAEDVKRIVLDGYNVDRNAMLRFISYLTETFYSFGQPQLKEYRELDGSLRNRTTSIDFYDLKLMGRELCKYKKEYWLPISKSAPLFERYKLDIVQKNKKPATSKPVAQKSATAQLPERAKVTQATTNTSRRSAKFEKLKRDPKAFFRDSKSVFLLPVRKLL